MYVKEKLIYIHMTSPSRETHSEEVIGNSWL